MCAKRHDRGVVELTDDQLSQATGGYSYCSKDGVHYQYRGSGKYENRDKYRCPQCGGILQGGVAHLGFYTCETCGAEYWNEGNLPPNLDSGAWQAVDVASIATPHIRRW